MRWILFCCCCILASALTAAGGGCDQVMISAQNEIVSLWGVFDLLHACRIAPVARKDFEHGCVERAQFLLQQLSSVSFLGNQQVEDFDSLYRYFSAMRSSFSSACHGTFIGEEILLRHLFCAIDELFFVIQNRAINADQKEQEISNPRRLCAFAAAVDPRS